MEESCCMWDVLPFAGMIMVDCMNVGISTLSKAAMTRGTSNFVFVVYTNALGTLILFPYFIFTRNKRPPLTFSLLCRFFLLGLTGSLGKTLFFTGVKYSSPTLSSAMGNLAQIFTFLLAIIFRMEKLDLRRRSSQAKSVGTVVSVAGALIVTLYKGPSLMASSSANLSHQLFHSQQSNWVLGGFLLSITNLMSAIWNVAQTATMKVYPEEMTIVFFYIFFVTIQSLAFTLVLERNPDAWKPKSGIEITAIIWTAIIGSVIRVSVHTWCLHKKGPVYVAMFRPLEIIFAAVLSIIFLGETLHLGSVIGSAIIAFGFYTLVWGKIKDKEHGSLDDGVGNSEPYYQKTPLLQSSSNEAIPRNL